jgi:hypothetical protein
MKQQPRILGWSMGRNRHGDSTGIYHLLVVDAGKAQARTACSKAVETHGSVMDEIPDDHLCLTCQKIAARYRP